MSKAFTKEPDNKADNDVDSGLETEGVSERSGPLSKIKKFYMTPAGFERLKQELRTLLNETRPECVRVVSWAASNGDRSENGDYIYGKRRLREIDRRIRFLNQRLERSEVVDPLETAKQFLRAGISIEAFPVRFGATVELEITDVELDTVESPTYAIVGLDELEYAPESSTSPVRRISWIAPLAQAVLGRVAGEVVEFQAPKGLQDVRIVSVKYRNID